MSACEKCWRDAGMRAQSSGGSHYEHYWRLLDERRNNPCSPEEQRGEQPARIEDEDAD
jgi:hypothetical protein